MKRCAFLVAAAVIALLIPTAAAVARAPLAGLGIDSNGRATVLLATGKASSPVVLRLTPSGGLDPTFAEGGVLRPPVSGISPRFALQPEGGLVVGGKRGRKIVLLRHRADGSRDQGFGERGEALVTYGGPLEAVMLQPHGQIVAFGTVSCVPERCGYLYRNLEVRRYTPQGHLLHEYRLSKEEWFFHAVGMDRRGGFIIAGRAVDLANETYDRLRPNGTPAGEIYHEVKLHPRDELEEEPSTGALVLDRDGRFALAPSYGAEIWRRNAKGDRDLSYGDRGRVFCGEAGALDSSSPGISSLLEAPGGRLVAAGGAGRCALVRYLPDGSPDPTFGVGGFAFTDSRMPLLQEIGLLPDGGVLAAGFDRGSNSVRLVRYTSAGRLDPAFGVEGLVSVPVPPG